VPVETPYVIALATDPRHGQGAQARSLLNRFVGSDVVVAQARERINAALGLAPDADLGPLLGNDLVIARTEYGLFGAWVVKDEEALRNILRERSASTTTSVVVRGPLVIAGESSAVQHALATKASQAGTTRRLFEERLLGLPADALVRAEANAALIPPAQRSKVAWVRALRRAAITVRADDDGLHARMRATAAPTPPDQIPLALGATPPDPLQRAFGVTVGVRDLRHIIRLGLATLKANDPGTYRRYDLARRALKFVRRGDIDRDVIDQLGGTATLWSPDLRTFTITAPVADPARMQQALNGLKPLMGRLLDAAGLHGARYGVVGETLVVTTMPGVSFEQLAAGRPARIDSLTGALTGVARAPSLRRILIDRLGLPPIASLALGALGDATLSVQAATTGITASGDLSIR
jgi:hypothetical protein